MYPDQNAEASSPEEIAHREHLGYLKKLYPWGEDQLRLQLESRDALIIALKNIPDAGKNWVWDAKEGKYV